MNPNKPWFWPDTQGFLAVAIITLMGAIVFILLLHPIQMDQLSQGVLMTVVGVLVGSLKDVYSYFFGSSKGSAVKDETIQTAVAAMPPQPQAGDTPHAAVH